MMTLESRFIQNLLREKSPALFWATRMFPIRTRDGLQTLYLFYRVACDLVLNAGSRDEAIQNIDRFQRMLEAGRTDIAVVDQPVVDEAILEMPDLGLAWEAWCGLEEEFAVPRAYALEFARGLALEAAGTRSENVDELLRQAYLTGGVIGLITFHILFVGEGGFDETLRQAAVNFGSSARLFEYSQNVYRDFTRGRIFAPTAWAPSGVTRVFSPRWAHDAEKKLATHATVLARAARPALTRLPWRLRLPIAMAIVWHREGQRSLLRKLDRALDEAIRQTGFGFRKNKRSTNKLPLASVPPVQEAGLALRNQSLIVKRDAENDLS